MDKEKTCREIIGIDKFNIYFVNYAKSTDFMVNE
jgi:hypothetical protein